MKRLLLILSIFLTASFSKDELSLDVNIVIDADTGWPIKVTVSGYSPYDQIWMGTSLYPFNTETPETDGIHDIKIVHEGIIEHEVSIQPILLDGSFEIAIWGEKVPKVDCTLEYCHWCKVNGFHLDDLLIYQSGLLTQLNGY